MYLLSILRFSQPCPFTLQGKLQALFLILDMR